MNAFMAFSPVLSALRRHLDTSQRAMIGGRFATLAHGRPNVANKGAKSPISSQRTIDAAAEMVNVGDRAIKDARTVLTGVTQPARSASGRGDGRRRHRCHTNPIKV
jgi:hypothetical protein